LLAKATATSAQCTFFSVSPADLASKWFGESERLVRQLFEMAREQRPSIVFVDDVDALFRLRGDSEHEASRRLKNEFLVQIEGVGHDESGVILLAATNVPWQLDPAFRRRFEKCIYVPLPDQEAREQMIRLHLGDTPNELSDSDVREIAEKLQRYSGSDLEHVVHDSIMEPVRELMQATYFKLVSIPHPRNPAMAIRKAIPCDEREEGALKISLLDIHESNLMPPREVTLFDFLSTLSRTQPTLTLKELSQYQQFHQDS